jgi:ankyrin repeat protein
MNNKRLNLLTICLISVIIQGLYVTSFAEETNTEAEQHFEKANTLRKAADYNAAVIEYGEVIKLSPNSRIAQDAQYWIGQSYFEAGQFDAALYAFEKILNEHPDTAIISSTKIMIEQVQLSKKTKSLFESVRKGDIEQVKKLISEGADVNKKDRRNCTVLHYAAQQGYRDIGELLISKGANVDAAGPGYLTPLYYAVQHGHRDIAELLIVAGADLNAKEPPWFTPLQHAVRNGHRDMAELLHFAALYDRKELAVLFTKNKVIKPSIHVSARLGKLTEVKDFLENGVDVNVKDVLKRTPLHYSAMEGKIDIARLLIEAGADLNYKDKDGQLAASLAMENWHMEMAELLVSKGSDVTLDLAVYLGDLDKVKSFIKNQPDVNEAQLNRLLNLSFYYKSIYQGNTTVPEYLLDKGANPNRRSNYDATILQEWAWGGDPELTKIVMGILIKKGADVNARSHRDLRWTPLHGACTRRRGSVAEFLVENGADINAKDGKGQTPLLISVQANDLDTTKMLIKNGADVHVKNDIGLTLMDIAWKRGYMEIVELLKKHGIKQTQKYEQSIEMAINSKDLEKVKELIAQGADVNARDSRGNMALHRAIRVRGLSDAERLSLVKILISGGADVNVKDRRRGATPLHLVVFRGNKELVELLIQNGADVNAIGDQGETPLGLAKQLEHSEIVELLQKHGAKE